MTISIDSQIAAVKDEIVQRQRVYPNLVSKGTMRPAVAELKLVHMRAVLQTLEWLKRNEAAIRGRIDAAGKSGETT